MKKAVFVNLLNQFWDHHGIYSMAAVMKAGGIDVSYVGTHNFNRARENLAQLQPDFVLYSSFSATVPMYVQFDRMLKERMKVVSVIGGSAVTYGWGDLQDSTIDALCVGEGENAIVDFINHGVMGKNIFPRGHEPSGDYYPLAELNRLPLPDRSVVYSSDSLLRNAPSKQFFSGRGCPYDCTYCFNHKFRQMFKSCGPAVRKKSVDYLLEEITQVRRAYPLTNVIFNDDTFILNKKWFLEFCSRFPREIGLPYTCNIRANLVDEDIVRGLKDSNCRNVNWSIEAGNEQLRNRVLRRNLSDEQILRTAELLHKYNIVFRIGNVIALPGESLQQMDETVEINIRARPYIGLANIFVPFPGLDLTEYAKRIGCYQERPQADLPRDYFTRSVLNYMPRENRQIYKLMCLFPVLVNFPAWFHRPGFRALLFKLPRLLLRCLYEMIYTYKMSRMYVVKTPLRQKVRMAIRYLCNL